MGRIMERERDGISRFDILRRLLNALAIDANIAGLDDRLRKRPGFHDTDEVEETIDSQWRRSFSSSANA
jgi:hypothetical protein